MIITNYHELPAPFLAAVSHQRRPQRGRISVTELIKPPQIRILEHDHWDELEEDASERTWALLGTAVHYVLEHAAPHETLQEETLEIAVGDWQVTGTPDLYVAGGDLWDYKVTSTGAYLRGVKREWEEQINMYAFLYRRYGWPVRRAQVLYILRDWFQARADRAATNPRDDYPLVPAMTSEIPLWDDKVAEAWMLARLELHKQAHAGNVLACTDKDRWYEPKYAVMKPGQKRAVAGGVHDARDEAEAMIAGSATLLSAGAYVEERPGEYRRCLRYCLAAPFCQQWAETLALEAENAL